MVYKYYAIKGISAGKGPNGEVPQRQEIDAWSSKPENRTQVVLFLKALRRLQDVPPGDRDSFFQIAGIHGMPFTSWDEPFETEENVALKGYCTHANYLFPSWHRPYLLLYEQRLYEIMIDEIIPQYPESDRPSLREAADTWRLPYWDWAINPRVPWLAADAELQVSLAGKLETLQNPLYQFRMPNGKQMEAHGVGDVKAMGEDTIYSYGKCIATSRCPTEEQSKPDSRDWIQGIVNNQGVEKYLTLHSAVDGKNYGAAAELVYRLLTYPLDYQEFATTAVGENEPKVSADVNIEFIHNNVHWWAGGDGGHMSQIPVATFDPIFWLHHCNIDRLFAIWQELNPDKFFTDGYRGDFDQQVIGLPVTVTPTTPLRPFHKDEGGKYWTSEEVRDFRTLGYTYPDLHPVKPGSEAGFDADAYKTKLFEGVTLKYGVSRLEALTQLELSKAGVGKPLPEGMREVNGGIAGNDFAISIRYSKFAFGGRPFNIEIYLEPADGSGKHFTPDEYVTNVYNFSTPGTVNGQEVCSNCTDLQARDVRLTAYIPITPILNRLILEERLSSLKKDDVEAVLKRLYWQVTMAGRPLPEDQWEALNMQILVSMAEMSHSKDPTTPSKTQTEPEVLPDVGQPEPPRPLEPTAPQPAPPQPPASLSLTVVEPLKLEQEISTGRSITVESSGVNLTAPDRRDMNRVVFFNYDVSKGELDLDDDDYDVLVSVNIIRRLANIQIQTKPALESWESKAMLPFPAWLQGPGLKIRVDVKEGTFEVYLNDNHLYSLPKQFGNKGITHVQYEAEPDPPALGGQLSVTSA
ncbi:tyrosinase [Aspergillus undulatus]|uniref:tyrosinase n=1 Tax=Aspergillus undulatus TaxID=1810928 RepID=UPI003CCE1944